MSCPPVLMAIVGARERSSPHVETNGPRNGFLFLNKAGIIIYLLVDFELRRL
jgi:hypothetical protein